MFINICARWRVDDVRWKNNEIEKKLSTSNRFKDGERRWCIIGGKPGVLDLSHAYVAFSEMAVDPALKKSHNVLDDSAKSVMSLLQRVHLWPGLTCMSGGLKFPGSHPVRRKVACCLECRKQCSEHSEDLTTERRNSNPREKSALYRDRSRLGKLIQYSRG